VRANRSAKILVRHYANGRALRRPDDVIVEEPLEIRLDEHTVATTMRTPGHDFELAVGFLHAEGLLEGAVVRNVRYCGTGSAIETEFNVVSVETNGRGPAPTARLGPVTSACGICGSDQLATLTSRLVPLALSDALLLTPESIGEIAEDVAASQELFKRTGGVHAAALIDEAGCVRTVREDIGRHNAVDKVVGRLRLDGQLPASGTAMFVSSRASFEMVQKAWAAGIGTLIAISAPSELAIATARAAGMTLVGFVRGDSFNVYTGELA
jgi:FdhD protein